MKKALQIIIWLVVILMLVGLALILYGTYIGTSVLSDLPMP